jgi:tetratricopeptide (TPR) repeat protein
MQRFVILGLVCLCGVLPAGKLQAADIDVQPGVAVEDQIARARDAFRAGRYAEADGLFSSAIRRQKAAGAAEAAGASGLEMARALSGLGAVRRLEGRCEESADLIRRGIRMFSATPQPDPRELSWVWQTLAEAYRCSARYLDADHAYSHAWDLEAGAPAPDQQGLIDILSGLMVNYVHLGREDESEAVLARIQTFVDGDRLEPHQQAGLLNNLGTLRWRQGRLPEAEAAFRKGLLLAKKIVAPEDPTEAYLSTNLAIVLLARKAYPEAMPLFARSMALFEAGAEVSPEDVPQMLRNYAACLQKTGRKDEARKLVARAAAMARDFPRDRQAGAAVSVAELARGR